MKIKAVLDTNIFVSLLLQETGIPGQVYSWVMEHGELTLSLPMIDELETTLAKNKFKNYIDKESAKEFLSELRLGGVHVPVSGLLEVSRDRDDDVIIETAVVGGVDYVVTGDQDLLVLGEYAGVKIVTAREFLDIVG